MSIRSIVARFKKAHQAGLDLREEVKLAESLARAPFVVYAFWGMLKQAGDITEQQFNIKRLEMFQDYRKNAPLLGLDKFPKEPADELRGFLRQNAGLGNALLVRMRAFSA